MAFSALEIRALYVSEVTRHVGKAWETFLADCAGGSRVFQRKTSGLVQLAFEWE